jgi:hypothetical protein
MEAGLGNWYVPSGELYHLEGLEGQHPTLQAVRYDAWQFTKRWSDFARRL